MPVVGKDILDLLLKCAAGKSHGLDSEFVRALLPDLISPYPSRMGEFPREHKPRRSTRDLRIQVFGGLKLFLAFVAAVGGEQELCQGQVRLVPAG